jgi:hypothetical protein
VPRIIRELPPRAVRDALLYVEYADDAQPPGCEQPGHRDAKTNSTDCDTCNATYLWRQRMRRRFYARGLRLTFDDREYHDPEPPLCRGHSFSQEMCKVCAGCRARRQWLDRRAARRRRQGINAKFSDWDVLLPHLRKLTNAGMTACDIADAAPCSRPVVNEVLTGNRTWIRTEIAELLLGIPVPARVLPLVPDAIGRTRRRIDATGTKRRIYAACRAGHTLTAQATRLGYGKQTVDEWLAGSTVPVAVAEEVAALYPDLIANPGPSRISAGMVAARGWPEARYFSATNIDDPDYQPFAIITKPVGLHRRLQALAWEAHGPREVAALLGESIAEVTRWLNGGPAPAYATHLVDQALEELARTPGLDRTIARQARRLGWAPVMAWYGIDIDDPKARPRVHVAAGYRKTDHPLESQVFQALLGLIPVCDLLDPERLAVVRALHRMGWSPRRIAAWTRWNPDGDLDLGAEAVARYQDRNGIAPAGLQVALGDRDHIVVPAAA